jgi:hypothetical protein
MWGHSYLDETNVGNSSTNLVPNTNCNFGYIFASALGMQAAQVRNHAVTGSQLTNPVRAGGANTGGGFARMLSEIYKTKVPFYPFPRSGNAHLICTGLNDIGYTAAASQATMRATAVDCLTVIVSKMRASVIINGNTSTLGLTYSGTWAAAAAAAVDYTSGNGWATSTTAGTFTFVIPLGYQGEPICFAMVGYSSTNACSVTWSGTAGITGTTTLNSRAFAAESIVPFRITTLNASNAGQTIIGTVALTSSTFILDGVFIEAINAVPVFLCTTPRLPSHIVNIASGGGTTAGSTTTFTDSTIAFNATTDVNGAVLRETDAQGAFTGNVNTISSITNATTAVLGTATVAGAKSGIKYTLQRNFNGYPTNSWTNTDFTGATVANHYLADQDVLNWNTQVIYGVKNLFDAMVQVVDLDGAIGADATCPSNVYSWFDSTSFAHPNDQGTMMCGMACYNAALQLRPPTNNPSNFGILQNTSTPLYRSIGKRRIIQTTAIAQGSGQWYLPENANIDVVANAYTAVAGDLFAFPFEISESAIYAMGCSLEQIGATGTSSVRVGLYNDLAGPDGNPSGYPQSLIADGGLTSLTAANSVQALGNFYRAVYPGLWWIAFGISTLNTASTLRTIFGPSPVLPSWNHTVNGVVRPIAWKVTGQTLTSNMPEVFPTGGSLVGCAGGTFASASAAPLVALELHVF